jgi:WD40 repeat protein
VVRRWDVATGKEVGQFNEAGVAQEALVLSSDGKSLASASGDGLRMLATGGWDREISLWDPATGKERRRLDGHEGSVYALVFSPDGKTLVSASCENQFIAGAGNDPSIRYWDVASGR